MDADRIQYYKDITHFGDCEIFNGISLLAAIIHQLERTAC